MASGRTFTAENPNYACSLRADSGDGFRNGLAEGPHDDDVRLQRPLAKIKAQIRFLNLRVGSHHDMAAPSAPQHGLKDGR